MLGQESQESLEEFVKAVESQFEETACLVGEWFDPEHDDPESEPMVRVFMLKGSDYQRFRQFEHSFFDQHGCSFLVLTHFVDATKEHYAETYKRLVENRDRPDHG